MRAGPGRLPAAAEVSLSLWGRALAAPCGGGTAAPAKPPRALRPSGARPPPEGKPGQAAQPLRDYTSRRALRRGSAVLPGDRATPCSAIGRIRKEAAAAAEREPRRGRGRAGERGRGVWERRGFFAGRGMAVVVARGSWGREAVWVVSVAAWRPLPLGHLAAVPVTREELWAVFGGAYRAWVTPAQGCAAAEGAAVVSRKSRQIALAFM